MRGPPLLVERRAAPLSSTVAAARELFGNPGWSGDSWIAAHAIELGS